MTISERVAVAWERIVGWLAVHLPGAIENLEPPATEAQLSELEAALGQVIEVDVESCILRRRVQDAAVTAVYVPNRSRWSSAV